jgi:aflatoxin B1 aldehyde reductase
MRVRQSDGDGSKLEPTELAEALAEMVGAGLTEYDTARSYGTEHLLGAALSLLPPEVLGRISVSTKSSPVAGSQIVSAGDESQSKGGFSRNRILEQWETSSDQLGRDSVFVLYLHNPDLVTDLDETLAALNELWDKRVFTNFGLSNFPAWQVMQIYMKCKERYKFRPTVYQGCYNPLARQCEAEIIPCCQMLGMRFNAYSPWAAGMLQSPWAAGSNSTLRGAERGRYYGGANATVGMDGSGKSEGIGRVASAIPTALSRIDGACRAAGIPIAEATARWHFYHSAMQARGHAMYT